MRHTPAWNLAWMVLLPMSLWTDVMLACHCHLPTGLYSSACSPYLRSCRMTSHGCVRRRRLVGGGFWHRAVDSFLRHPHRIGIVAVDRLHAVTRATVHCLRDFWWSNRNKTNLWFKYAFVEWALLWSRHQMTDFILFHLPSSLSFVCVGNSWLATRVMNTKLFYIIAIVHSMCFWDRAVACCLR